MPFAVRSTLIQHHKLTTFRAVEARVLSSEIEVQPGRRKRGRISHKPIVKYTYEIEGRSYTSQRIKLSRWGGSGREWANRIVEQFPAGQTVKAYYNPNDPTEAVLIRAYVFEPYGAVLLSMFLLFWGIGSIVGFEYRLRPMPPPVATTGGWFSLTSKRSTGCKKWVFTGFSVIWHSLAIVICGHYFKGQPPPYSIFAIAVTSSYEAVGVMPIALAIYYWLQGMSVSDASLVVKPDQFILGAQIEVHMEQTIRSNSRIDESSVGLICREIVERRAGPSIHGWKSEKTIVHEDKRIIKQESQALKVEKSEYTGIFDIPPELPGSTSVEEKGFPCYEWYVEVVTRIRGRPNYKAKFPIIVEST